MKLSNKCTKICIASQNYKNTKLCFRNKNLIVILKFIKAKLLLVLLSLVDLKLNIKQSYSFLPLKTQECTIKLSEMASLLNSR